MKIDLKSRDDIENVLRGMQHLYVNRWSDFQRIFDEEFFADVDWNNGRPYNYEMHNRVQPAALCQNQAVADAASARQMRFRKLQGYLVPARKPVTR